MSDAAPAQAVFAMDRLTDLVRKRWPEEKGEPADIIERLLKTLPPGKGALIGCELIGCTAQATHRLLIEKAVDALHLKYNGKPVSGESHNPGVRKHVNTCDEHIETLMATLIVEGKPNPSVSVVALVKE